MTTIAPAHPAQAAQLELARAKAHHLTAQLDPAPNWEELLADPFSAPIWVAVDDGTVVGAARAVALGAGQVRPLALAELWVAPSQLGSPLAQALLNYAISDAPAQVLIDDGDQVAAEFFARHGFIDPARDLSTEPGAARANASANAPADPHPNHTILLLR